MTVQTRAVGTHSRDAVVVDLPEEWPRIASTPWDQLDLLASLARTSKKLVLDLGDLCRFDGETAAMLVALHRSIEAPDVHVSLVARAETPSANMAIRRLRRFYPIHESLDEAIDAFSQ